MTLGVLVSHQRNGLATMLLKKTRDYCIKKYNIKRMVLHVKEDNLIALKYYKKNNFYIDNKIINYYTINNNYEHAYYLIHITDKEYFQNLPSLENYFNLFCRNLKSVLICDNCRNNKEDVYENVNKNY